MERKQRKDFDGVGTIADRSIIHSDRNISWPLPYRISTWWINTLRSVIKLVERQKMRWDGRLRLWAHRNAWRLVFANVMFLVTWITLSVEVWCQ